MAERRPLVRRDDGNLGDLPTGDVVPGINSRHPFPMPRVNDWLAQPALVMGSTAYANGQLFAGLLFLPGPFTYDAVALRITNAGSTGALIKVVAYADDTGRPGSLVLDSPTVAATATGHTPITGISLVVPAGGLLMWAGTVTQGSPTTTPTVFRVNQTPFPAITTSAPDLSFSPSTAFTTSGITGAAPAAPTFGTSDGHTRLTFRRSA